MFLFNLQHDNVYDIPFSTVTVLITSWLPAGSNSILYSFGDLSYNAVSVEHVVLYFPVVLWSCTGSKPLLTVGHRLAATHGGGPVFTVP